MENIKQNVVFNNNSKSNSQNLPIESEQYYSYNDLQKPSWIKVKAPQKHLISPTENIVLKYGLKTVCQEAACPNIGECWKKKHATFMIMGSICTRSCKFCNVSTGKPYTLDKDEPLKIAQAINEMGFKHVVITSVDRDDLDDGGAMHFYNTIKQIRTLNKSVTIEILTPDFLKKAKAPEIIAKAQPDVFNHNIETVPSLYHLRPGARYFNSLQLLSTIKSLNPNIYTKSGIMVGLGENDDEVLQVMDDLRAANVDFITIGQYLQPSPNHAKVKKYVTPEIFLFYEITAKNKGFKMVSSGAMVRSSYHAGEDFEKLKKNMTR